MRMRWMMATLVATLPATAASAQPHGQAPATPPASAATGASAVPQQTTATFADWTLRCSHTSPTVQVCEVAQGINSQEHTVAQVAIGRVAKGQPLHLTILVPPSVTFADAPALVPPHDEPAVLTLTWRRCLPGGCMADGVLTDDVMRRVRGWTNPARITFADAAGRTIALPFSPAGLPQALDALAKEDGG
jgi:invasion protein IalB